MNSILGNAALMCLVKLVVIAGIDFFLFWRFGVPRIEIYANAKVPQHDYVTHPDNARRHTCIRGAFGFMNATILLVAIWAVCFC